MGTKKKGKQRIINQKKERKKERKKEGRRKKKKERGESVFAHLHSPLQPKCLKTAFPPLRFISCTISLFPPLQAQ